jgi:glutamate racemase
MIGIFDSGIGGLTVVKKMFEILPDYQLLYFGDTARTPYGNRGEEVIKKYALEDAEFLIKKGAKVIVIACNTASAVAAEDLKKKLSVPVFEVVLPAVEKATQVTRNKKIGVIGTRATINSGIYEKLIQSHNNEYKVFSQAAPLLVPLVEEGWLNRPETKTIIKKYLHPLRLANIDTLILGCTHFPLLKEIIKVKIGKNRKLVDSGEEVVLKLKEFLEKNKDLEKSLEKNKNHEFFVSDLTPRFQEIAEKWLGRKIKLEKASL